MPKKKRFTFEYMKMEGNAFFSLGSLTRSLIKEVKKWGDRGKPFVCAQQFKSNTL